MVKCFDRTPVDGGYAQARMVSEARRFLLDPEEARTIIDKMEDVVRREWYGVARACGVSEADCEAIRRAYVYPGFRA